ncbi:[protein release factor]-glutamine N5-methyltransferase [Bisgaardia hudsonensis]|uniref:Release factor glutamine methyltransferase n=1 Tax=Bisgaardia hudsonensis TaxID=109472 RepID=A0A4R2N0Z1_9PAST|nr:peptide chain release factor N(5)-glutamine methyltransferase [Bisgaardia hudsonensis]TCP13173.1 [protein release factor]-glutamine N5-methyltransferase [Bisgaardia hudsonensis]
MLNNIIIQDSQNYQQWLANAIKLLSEHHLNDPYADPKVDANVLLEFVTKKTRSYILAFPETLLKQNEIEQLSEYVLRRTKGEPIAYILGEKAFWNLILEVSKDTLIPRADTEILVEKAIDIIKLTLKQPHFLNGKKKEFNILDLGTGTGAIALALAYELFPLFDKCGIKLNIIGVDFLESAVSLAKRNAERNQLRDKVQFIQSDWFKQLPKIKFDLIVSNPPYIDEEDENLTQGDVIFEPKTALIANEQGYADLRLIIEQSPHYLQQKGWLILEHGWQQGEKVRSIFKEFLWQKVETAKDYNNNDRITLGQINNN